MFSFIETFNYLSTSFILFIIIGYLIFLFSGEGLRKYIVLLLNITFLLNIERWPALTFYFLLTFLVYYLGLLSSRKKRFRRLFLYLGCVLVILVFFIFRVEGIRSRIDVYLNIMTYFKNDFLFMVGYSYFMFKSINYLTSAYVGKIKTFNIVTFFNFVFFFPAFTSGPIDRYNNFQNEKFDDSSKITPELFISGLQRILTGIIKKYIIADLIRQYSLIAFSGPENIQNVLGAWIGTFCYFFYIYIDFSAYTDIAIGIGLLFGYKLPENFNYPLIKSNLIKFWENWNISLTSWIRDHIFVPLNWQFLKFTGYKENSILSLINYLVTMGIIGLWHSFSFPFLLFGIINGLGLFVTQKFISFRKYFFSAEFNQRFEKSLVTKLLGIMFVNVFLSLSLILFRYDLNNAVKLLKILFGGELS